MKAPFDFVDELFMTAAGTLGWEPEVIWHTPVPQIILAIEGRYDFAIKTNPFGAGKSSNEKPKKAKTEDPELLKAKQQNQVLKFDMMKLKVRQNKMGLK